MIVSDTLQWLEALVGDVAVDAKRLAGSREARQLQRTPTDEITSAADRQLEELVRSRIHARFPDSLVLGEEMGGTLGAQDTGWVVDPIDGTTNFASSLPMWGISIALVRNGQPELGAIALPEFGVVLSAERRGGVRLNGSAMARPQRSAVRLFGVGENSYEPPDQTEKRAVGLRLDGYRVLRLGSAVFCLANATLGRLEGYVEHGCRIWDVAAAAVICAEAGLIVSIRDLEQGFVEIDARWPS